MLTNYVTPETFHFINWALHSGLVDTAEEFKLCLSTAQRKLNDGTHRTPEEYEAELSKEITRQLERWVDTTLAELCENELYCGHTAQMENYTRPEHYRSDFAVQSLFMPLLNKGLAAIDRPTVARMVKLFHELPHAKAARPWQSKDQTIMTVRYDNPDETFGLDEEIEFHVWDLDGWVRLHSWCHETGVRELLVHFPHPKMAEAARDCLRTIEGVRAEIISQPPADEDEAGAVPERDSQPVSCD